MNSKIIEGVDLGSMVLTGEQFMLSAMTLSIYRPTSSGNAIMPLFPVLTNTSFSIEIFIKTIFYLENNKIQSGHKLDSLFDILSEESRNDIMRKTQQKERYIRNHVLSVDFENPNGKPNFKAFKSDSEINNENFNKNLIMVSGFFEKFRYIYENKLTPFHAPLPFLLSFCLSAREKISEKQTGLITNFRLPSELLVFFPR